MPQTTKWPQPLGLVRGLGPWAAAAIVVGTMIGTGIFLKPSEMAAEGGSVAVVFAAWIVGGLLSLVWRAELCGAGRGDSRGRRRIRLLAARVRPRVGISFRLDAFDRGPAGFGGGDCRGAAALLGIFHAGGWRAALYLPFSPAISCARRLGSSFLPGRSRWPSAPSF